LEKFESVATCSSYEVASAEGFHSNLTARLETVLSFAGELKTGDVRADGRLGVGVGVSAGLGAQAKPKT